MINNRNINKDSNYTKIMPKRGVGITLDEDIVKAIQDIKKNSRGAKISPIINSLLREHPEIKKRLKRK